MLIWQFFRKGWDGRALLVQPSKTHHSIWKIIFVLGADEYLERLEGKIRGCLFFYVKNSKITVWNELRMNSNNHRVNLCLDTYIMVFVKSISSILLENPILEVEKDKLLCKWQIFHFRYPYIFWFGKKIRLPKFVDLWIRIFVIWHHHSDKSLSCIEYGWNFIVLSKNSVCDY